MADARTPWRLDDAIARKYFFVTVTAGCPARDGFRM
jgi:hypothetical protein